jgi:hypothetical protein
MTASRYYCDNMKYKVNFFIFFLVYVQSLFSQSPSIPNAVSDSIESTLDLIKANNVSRLATKINYPLIRRNPLPDIEDSTQFILHYSLLFDSAFITTVGRYKMSDFFEHHDFYGISRGDIWFDDIGNIQTLNYSSQKEMEIKNQLSALILNKMHRSIKPWKENILVWKSKKYLIRVDDTNKGLRYSSWSTGKSYGDKPDLIIYKGVQEYQGTEGGVTYSFIRGDWSYVLDDNWMAENDDDGGMHLRILYKGVEKESYKCTNTK